MGAIDKDAVLKQIIDSEERIVISRVFDKIDAALKQHTPQYLHFLDPTQQMRIKEIARTYDDVKFLFNGGYKGAERIFLTVVPSYYYPDVDNPGIKALRIHSSAGFEGLTHRDFLGSILGLGIKREKLGDILIHSEDCDIILAEEIADYVLFNLKKVQRTTVQVKEIEFEQIISPVQQVKEINTTVSSMRIDCVAAAGFGVSRTKMAREITAQQVKVNWQVENNVSKQLNCGDIISMKGRGRVKLEAILGTSKSGKTRILLKRYI